MEKKTDLLANIKGADELHIKDVGVFFIKDRKAYYADGRPVEKDKLFVCQYCQNSPPFVASKEIDFVKHMIDKHPEHATKKIEKAVEKVVEKVDAGKEIDPAKVAKKTAKKK